MAYNTKPIVTDVDGNPISQYYNPDTDSYEPVEGQAGANKVVLYNADGTENNSLSLIPILEKLSELTGTVIDEQTRQSNEQQRITFYNQLVEMLNTGQLKGDKGDTGETGRGLEFDWDGTRLGVRMEGDEEYIYVDLRGPQGPPGEIENLTSQHIEDALGYLPVSPNDLEELRQEVEEAHTSLNDRLGNVENLDTTEKANLVLALNETYQELAAHKADIMPHATANDITLYVSVSGDDGTGDGSQEKPFASLQKAVDTLPLVINHKVTINILTGEYDYTTATIIEGIIANINSRIGSGMLIIDGGDKDTTIFKLPEQSPSPRSFMGIKNNNILIQLQNITFEKVGAVDVNYKWGLRIEKSNVYINNCKFINIGRIGNYSLPTIGYYNGSAGFVENCTFENCGNCIAVGYWGSIQPPIYHLPSDIVSKNNTGTPVLGYGLVAVGGTIRKVNTQPTGGLGDELLRDGGQII